MKNLTFRPAGHPLPQLAQQEFGGVDVGFDGVDRTLGDQLHADGGRQVIDFVGVGHQSADQLLVGHGPFGVAEPGMVQDGGQIVDRAGGFIVDHRHPIAACQQRFDQVAADEAGPAGNNTVFHGNE